MEMIKHILLSMCAAVMLSAPSYADNFSDATDTPQLRELKAQRATMPVKSEEVKEVLSQPAITWQQFWKEHPKQQKVTKPIRWTWDHLGIKKAWSFSGRPTFQTFCALGQAGQQTGATSGLQFFGAMGNIATPFSAHRR
jgi:hypothetical protein